jgi:hypothetical protein
MPINAMQSLIECAKNRQLIADLVATIGRRQLFAHCCTIRTIARVIAVIAIGRQMY